MKHDWTRVHGMDEKHSHGFHPLDAIRMCENCYTYQKREPLYDGTYGNRGPKVTGYRWTPPAGRCEE